MPEHLLGDMLLSAELAGEAKGPVEVVRDGRTDRSVEHGEEASIK